MLFSSKVHLALDDGSGLACGRRWRGWMAVAAHRAFWGLFSSRERCANCEKKGEKIFRKRERTY